MVKLAYLIEELDMAKIETFETLLAAQVFDRFLRKRYGDKVISKVIYDGYSPDHVED